MEDSQRLSNQMYFRDNRQILAEFQKRTSAGMNLSQRVWNLAGLAKNELEAAIGTAMSAGISAVALSKRVSRYLVDFDSLKRNYWQKYGIAADIHDCEYRAARLARTEINMAYRRAEQERWKQLDFVRGYIVCTGKAHPFPDVCDDLEGEYPKDFNFSGWHPNCYCYTIPILQSEDSFFSINPEDGEKPITNLPDNFIEWEKEQEKTGRIALSLRNKTLPYFLRDNGHIENGRWVSNAIGGHKGELGQQGKHDKPNERLAEKTLNIYRPKPLDDSLRGNAEAVAKELGIELGKPMSYEEVNYGRENWHDNGDHEYGYNCQSCVLATELRFRGINATAKGYFDSGVQKTLSENMAFCFCDKDGKDISKPKMFTSREEVLKALKAMGKNGRLHIGWEKCINRDYGHIVSCILIDGVTYIHDPQNGERLALDDMLRRIDIAKGIQILKVDKLFLKKGIIKDVVSPL